MDEQTLTDETIAAREAGDERRLNELARAEKMGTLGELDPKYAESDNDSGGAGEIQDSGDTTGESSDLEARMERSAQLNERAGAEGTAEALRRLKGAEDPQKALEKAHRRAQNMGDEYAAAEFEELLTE